MQLIMDSVRRQAAVDADGAQSRISDLGSIQESFDAAVERGIQEEEERQHAVDSLLGRQQGARRKGDSLRLVERVSFFVLPCRP
jgi:hypothetical protein